MYPSEYNLKASLFLAQPFLEIKYTMRMLVLAGGFGERLKKVVSDVPKPLAPINGTPFLQFLIEYWVSNGLLDFTFLLHHKSEQVIDFLNFQKTLYPSKVKIDWLVEKIPMGTGGAIASAVHELNLKDDFLVSNADTWVGCGIKKIFASKAPSILTVQSIDVSRYGEIKLDKNSIVTAIQEKGQIKSAGWINAGQYKLCPEFFKNMHGKFFSLEKKVLVTLVENSVLKAILTTSDFIDIGIPSDYFRFCDWINSDKRNKL